MRVVAGKYKGRRLEPPKDNEIRPTTDKVKEALFSILMNDIEDVVFCDIFSGSGGIGIEALSRGASKCFFIENSRESLRLLNENLKKCEIKEPYEVIASDFRIGISKLSEKVDIAFLDPPYERGLEIEALQTLEEEQVLGDDAIVIVEHARDTNLSDEIGRFVKIKQKIYGKIALSFYEVARRDR